MKRSLVDSSSAILLFKCGVFEMFLDNYVACVSTTVYNEITREGHEGAMEFKGHGRFGKLHVIGSDKISYNAEELAHLGPGERDIIRIYKSGRGDFVLIDDRKGGLYCTRNNVPYINALLALKLLHFKGVIEAGSYRKKFDYLVSIGRYSESIIDYAAGCSINDLHLFM